MRNIYWMVVLGVAVASTAILTPTAASSSLLPVAQLKTIESNRACSDNCDGLTAWATIHCAVSAQGIPIADCKPILIAEGHYHRMEGGLCLTTTERSRIPITIQTAMPFIREFSDPLERKMVVSASNGGSWFDVITGTQTLVVQIIP